MVRLKYFIQNLHIFDIIITTFIYKYEFHFTILIEFNENLKIYFNYIILLFHLTINLKIKDNRKSLIKTNKII